jgi:hypothetical protein
MLTNYLSYSLLFFKKNIIFQYIFIVKVEGEGERGEKKKNQKKKKKKKKGKGVVQKWMKMFNFKAFVKG